MIIYLETAEKAEDAMRLKYEITDKTQREVDEIRKEIASKMRGKRYHLQIHTCFNDEIPTKECVFREIE